MAWFRQGWGRIIFQEGLRPLWPRAGYGPVGHAADNFIPFLFQIQLLKTNNIFPETKNQNLKKHVNLFILRKAKCKAIFFENIRSEEQTSDHIQGRNQDFAKGGGGGLKMKKFWDVIYVTQFDDIINHVIIDILEVSFRHN